MIADDLNKETIPICVFENDEDVDSLLNGYHFDSSSDEDDYSNDGEYQHEDVHGDDNKVDFFGEESHVAINSNMASDINPNMEKEIGYNTPIMHIEGEDHKRSWLKRLCSENKVTFMGIQETMTRTLNRFAVKSLSNSSPFDFVYKNSNGKSGGILVD
ncbi:hypothetical protein Tco_0901134 [Tanacetum coccineum]